MTAILLERQQLTFVDHGAGKSYLGFILYDLYLKDIPAAHVYGIESRRELVEKSCDLASRLGFEQGMSFMDMTVEQVMRSLDLPATVDIVTALHACDTATDDAIRFALGRQAQFIVVVPCCQAEVAAHLRSHKNKKLS